MSKKGQRTVASRVGHTANRINMLGDVVESASLLRSRSHPIFPFALRFLPPAAEFYMSASEPRWVVCSLVPSVFPLNRHRAIQLRLLRCLSKQSGPIWISPSLPRSLLALVVVWQLNPFIFCLVVQLGGRGGEGEVASRLLPANMNPGHVASNILMHAFLTTSA